jgi:RHS repeat-associated protein
MTRRAYDEWTQRVARIRTERVVHAPGSLTWAGTGSPFQDVGHAYDPTGNVLQLDDRTPGCGVRGGALGADRLRRTFRYDPLYRLLSGTGRACSGPARPLIAGLACGVFDQPFAPGAPAPTQANAPDLTEEYREAYAYDPAGNLLEIAYRTGSRLRWRRRFAIGNRNRVASLNSGGATQALAYDARGNLRRQGVDRRFGWDHADRLTSFTVQAGAAPTFEARYLHGADGTRVKRWIRRNGGATESTVYVEGAFEEDRWSQGGVGRRANRVHVLDDATRVAVVQLGDRDDRDAGPPVQYHHGDHLRSSTLVVDAVGGWVNREEFTPYGETSFGSFGRKRYRYAGREREDESGLTRHGSRHYAGFLGRWISPDPLGAAAGLNPYRYVRGNPMTYDDRSGLQEDEAEGAEPAGQPKTLEDVQNEKLGPLMNFFGLNKAARLEQEWTDEDPSKLYEAREVRAKGVTAAGEAGVATGEAAMLAHPAPEAEVDALSATIGRKVGSAIDRVKGAVQDTGAAIGRAVSAAGEAAGKVGEYFRSVGPELRKVAGEMSHTLGSGTAWIEDVGRVLLKSPEVASESRLIRAGAQPLDDLAKMRGQLHLPPPGPGSPTLARLDIGGKSFYGISGVKDIDLVVNPISRTHAEADVFQQAANAGVTAETATLYVDYPNGLCLACAGNGGVDTLARQLGLREVQVVGPNFSYPYRVAPGP